ncbi:MAG: asparaginase [Clostridia bacterium]|nr:asparaginase [Clostridia bacterium]
MKILFVFTGGTIGTTESGGVRSADPCKPYKIISAYKSRYGIDFEYDTKEPYNELSENNTGLNISALVRCVAESLSGGYDGIVVTHGTDTLQYSASALGYCLGSSTPPICLVSSNAPIEDESSNALINLRGAIRFIEEKAGSGVFSVYSNKGGSVNVHRGTRLIGPKAYSDASYSIFGQIYASFDESFGYHKNAAYSERADDVEPFGCVSLSETNEATLVISPYPGMVYPKLPSGIKYVILNTYHSGTVNTKSEAAREFFLSAKEKGITVFATGIEEGVSYESMSIFEELGITPVKNLSPIAAYMKLWLADSIGLSPISVLDRSLAGDIADS